MIEYEMAYNTTQGIMDDYDLTKEDQYVSAMAIMDQEPAGMAEHQEVLQRFATSLVERVRPILLRHVLRLSEIDNSYSHQSSSCCHKVPYQERRIRHKRIENPQETELHKNQRLTRIRKSQENRRVNSRNFQNTQEKEKGNPGMQGSSG